MQEAKPSFLQYFEQKEKEDNKNSSNDSHKLPAEGDMEVVSSVHWVVAWWHFYSSNQCYNMALTNFLCN